VSKDTIIQIIAGLLGAGSFATLAIYADKLARASVASFESYPAAIQRALNWITRDAASTPAYYFWQFRIGGFLVAGLILIIVSLVFVLRHR